MKSDLTPKERESLAKHIGDSDELLVLTVTGRTAAWKGFSDKGSKWIKDSL